MKIDTKTMSGEYKKVYEVMWDNFDFESIGACVKGNKEMEPREEGEEPILTGSSSFQFCQKPEDEGKPEKMLERVFDISEKVLFEKQFKLVTTGQGDEINKITTVHSSSLAALLFFYNLENKNLENKTLELSFETMDGTKTTKRRVEFNQSYFEFKSPVIGYPSNMDVVLIGEDKNDNQKPVVLLLESKFSEYYVGASYSYTISKSYGEREYSKDIYKKESIESIGIEREDKTNGDFQLVAKGEKVYLEGVKQMISHYYGIRRVLNGEEYKEEGDRNEMQTEVCKAIGDEKAVVILGEILFDRGIGSLKIGDTCCFDSYSKLYEGLMKVIAKEIKEKEVKRFEVLKDVLKYSDLKDCNQIGDNIRKFYFSGEEAKDETDNIGDKLNQDNIITFYRKIKYLSASQSDDIADKLISNKKLFEKIPTIYRQDKDGNALPYRKPSGQREGKPQNPNPDTQYEKTGTHTRNEEYLAMELFNKCRQGQNMLPLPQIGFVLDYQMPIGGNSNHLIKSPDSSETMKIVDPDNCEKEFNPGKCDLITYEPEENVFYLLELKDEDSKESILGTAIEAYTYLKLLNTEQVVEDMKKVYPNLDVYIKDKPNWVAATLIIKGSNPYDEYMDQNHYKKTRELIREFGIKVIVWNRDEFYTPRTESGNS